MKYKSPHKQILSKIPLHWNRDQTRPAVRRAFTKLLRCRTAELGGRVYAFSSAYYDRNAMMEAWRTAVVALLRTALRASQLRTTVEKLEEMLTHQEKRWWSIKIQFQNKGHFLLYAGRYVKRPPMAQRRITWIGERTVRFLVQRQKAAPQG
jgi:hypothetical protein